MFLKEPSIPGLTKQKDALRGKNPITGIVSLERELNTTRCGTCLLHGENRAKHVRSASGNNTRVRALDIGPEAIKGPIAGPLLWFP